MVGVVDSCSIRARKNAQRASEPIQKNLTRFSREREARFDLRLTMAQRAGSL
jgi:hypothetical protein